MAATKGGLPSVARPGGKGLARRNHEAALIPWNGRAQRQKQVLESIPRRGDPAGPLLFLPFVDLAAVKEPSIIEAF